MARDHIVSCTVALLNGLPPPPPRLLQISNKLAGPGCTTEYKAPSSTLTMLSPAQAAAQPADATWMLMDKGTMDNSVMAECGAQAFSQPAV